MNVLWLVNLATPEASLLSGAQPSPFGGWVVGMAGSFVELSDVSLSVVFPMSRGAGRWSGKAIEYYGFTPGKWHHRSSFARDQLVAILDEVRPDIVHVFGTEYGHASAMARLCVERSLPCIIWIQGLVSTIPYHYALGIPPTVQLRATLRDVLKLDNMVAQQSKLRRRGSSEIETLRSVRHVAGRTSWDEACVRQINPKVIYHFCNETLRPAFYDGSWALEACERHTIFVSQGASPSKALHLVLEALPLIRRTYPDVRLVVAGDVPHGVGGFSVRQSAYGVYLRSLMRRYRLELAVDFIGPQPEEEMRMRYLRCHVALLPSAIENSPNSLGEAMLLGVPCVASRVGGVEDMITNGVEGMTYQADAPYLLADRVCKIFADPRLARRLGASARARARVTHDQSRNANRLMQIYAEIVGADKATNVGRPLD